MDVTSICTRNGGLVYMIYELWAGEGKSACNTASPAVQSAYNTMMYIIIFGWAIYPIGYASGYLGRRWLISYEP